MTNRVTSVDWMLFASLVVAWGSSFVMSKVALVAVSPEWIAAGRLGIGALVVICFAVARGALEKPAMHEGALYVWLGVIGNAAPFLAITWGMQHVSSGVAGLLMGTIPFFVIVMSHFTLPGERLTWQRTLGFLLGFAGILVLIGPASIAQFSFEGPAFRGQLAIIAGCAMYGVNAISTKRFATGNAVMQSAGVLFCAAIISAAYAMSAKPFDLGAAPFSALLAIAGLGLLPTGLATVIYFKAIERTGPGFIAMTNYLVPVYALFFGALTLNESISWNALAALALILSGIAITRVRLQPLQ